MDAAVAAATPALGAACSGVIVAHALMEATVDDAAVGIELIGATGDIASGAVFKGISDGRFGGALSMEDEAIMAA